MGTVPVPYSPVAGDDATQARVLTWADAAAYLLGSATAGGSKRGLCVMRQTVAQTLTTGVGAALLFDTEDVDYDNGHSTVTNTSRYTAQTAGWYAVQWFASFAANATGVRDANIRVNGATDQNGRPIIPVNSGTVQTGLAGGRLIFLNAGDYIEVFALQSSGGNLATVVVAPDQSLLSVEWRSN